MEKIEENRLTQIVQNLNDALEKYSVKDWNYSRIHLQVRELSKCDDAYVLWCDSIDPSTAQGKVDLKALATEIAWGDRHSSELGILEIVSLRVNKALLSVAAGGFFEHGQPVLRVSKKEQLEQQGIVSAIWYEAQEISGEDFESR